MTASKLDSNAWPPSAPRAQRRLWAAALLAAACTTTSDVETPSGPNDATAASEASAGDANVPPDTSAGDASSFDASMGTVEDAGAPDRAVPSRPPPQDTGVTADVVAAPDTGAASDAGSADAAAAVTTISILQEAGYDLHWAFVPVVCNPDAAACAPGDAGDGSVNAVLKGCIADNGCLDPAQQGGTCETSDVMDAGVAAVPHFMGILDKKTGLTCDSLGLGAGVSETQVCLTTLSKMLSTQCAASLQLTPCLCGDADVDNCFTGSGTAHNGPLYETYACDFNATNSATINGLFTVQSFGAGAANSLVQCIGAFACPASLDAGAEAASH